MGGRTTDQFFSYTHFSYDQRNGLYQLNFKKSNWKTHPNLHLDEEFAVALVKTIGKKIFNPLD